MRKSGALDQLHQVHELNRAFLGLLQVRLQGGRPCLGLPAPAHAVVTAAQIAPLMYRRADRPLFCIDLAVPRDFEPVINDLDGVYLYDIDALQSIADASMQVRRAELVKCDAMIERHVAEYRDWLTNPRPAMPMNAQPEGAK